MSVLELRRIASRNVKRLLIKYDYDHDHDDNGDDYSGGDDYRDDIDDKKCDSFSDDKDCCDRFVIFIYFLSVSFILLSIYRLHDDDDNNNNNDVSDYNDVGVNS